MNAQTEPLVVTAAGVSKTYTSLSGEVNAVVDVSFDVSKGEAVAVMGPSGAGKSTLLHLVAGLETVSRGTIFVAGANLTEFSVRQVVHLRRRHIGFVFQFSSLLETLTVEDNVAIPGIIRRDSRSVRRERANELLRAVALEHRRSHYPSELSGGEQQRVALARALYAHPTVLLADEPTGNLDSRTGRELIRLITTTQRDLGGGLLLATHDQEVASICDRVIYLCDGKVHSTLALEGEVVEGAVTLKERSSLVSSWLQELGS